jgi:hypothetical protein
MRLIKTEMGCVRCGARDWRILDFHHINPAEKKDEVSNIANVGTWRALFQEIAKCIVLCRNCHGKQQYEARRALKRANRRLQR